MTQFFRRVEVASHALAQATRWAHQQAKLAARFEEFLAWSVAEVDGCGRHRAEEAATAAQSLS